MLKRLMPPWTVVLVVAVVVPILKRVSIALEEEAKKSPEPWDDVAAGAFKTVIDFIEGDLAG